jgi:hypothetical protein
MRKEVVDALWCEVQFTGNVFLAADDKETTLGIPYNNIATRNNSRLMPAFRKLQHPFVAQTNEAGEERQKYRGYNGHAIVLPYRQCEKKGGEGETDKDYDGERTKGLGLERLFTNSFDLDDADRERSEIVGITSRFPVSIVRYCYNCGTGRVTSSVFCGVW